jgi:hypothetical protein
MERADNSNRLAVPLYLQCNVCLKGPWARCVWQRKPERKSL